jgi:hypothetical protein
LVKSFLLTMLIGVGLATVAAVVVMRAAFPEPPAEAVARPRPPTPQQETYTPQDAVETVAARLGNSPTAERLKQSLRIGARTEYHSPRHWTVHFNEASWTAHGNGTEGPYAEPDNEAARLFEHAATGP